MRGLIDFSNKGYSDKYNSYVIHPSGLTVEVISEEIIIERDEKIENIFEDNKFKTIEDKIYNEITSVDSGYLQLKTLSTNGYQSVKNQSVKTIINRTISYDGGNFFKQIEKYSSRFIISYYKVDGNLISQETFEGKYAPPIVPDFSEPSDNGYAIKTNDGMLYVYRVENLSNPVNSTGLSISINKSQQNSIIGTIQSSSSKDVRVQSSQNI